MNKRRTTTQLLGVWCILGWIAMPASRGQGRVLPTYDLTGNWIEYAAVVRNVQVQANPSPVNCTQQWPTAPSQTATVHCTDRYWEKDTELVVEIDCSGSLHIIEGTGALRCHFARQEPHTRAVLETQVQQIKIKFLDADRVRFTNDPWNYHDHRRHRFAP
jgi:hypothetical protein